MLYFCIQHPDNVWSSHTIFWRETSGQSSHRPIISSADIPWCMHARLLTGPASGLYADVSGSLCYYRNIHRVVVLQFFISCPCLYIDSSVSQFLLTLHNSEVDHRAIRNDKEELPDSAEIDQINAVDTEECVCQGVSGYARSCWTVWTRRCFTQTVILSKLSLIRYIYVWTSFYKYLQGYVPLVSKLS